MNKGEQQFNQWFDEYADGVKVFEEADMKQAYLQGRAELEKENAELKEELTKKADTNHSLVEQMADLESENAELKEQCSILADCNTCVSDCKTENIEIKTQLTKAKEILKSLYFIIESRIDYKNNIGIADEMWRAEQFWKVEK